MATLNLLQWWKGIMQHIEATCQNAANSVQKFYTQSQLRLCSRMLPIYLVVRTQQQIESHTANTQPIDLSGGGDPHSRLDPTQQICSQLVQKVHPTWWWGPMQRIGPSAANV